MLKFFERRLEPTGPLPDAPPPTLSTPHAVLQFYWHFVRQIPGPIAAVFTTSFFVAITDAAIPVCIGRVVSLVSAQDPQTIWDRAGFQLLAMAGLLLVLRPVAHFALSIIGIWYIVVYGTSAVALLAAADWRLSLPILLWFCVYGGVLATFLPKMRERSRRMSEMRSNLTGKVVDSYTNILTVKLFARARDEDAFVREAIDEHTEAWRAQQRLATLWNLCLTVMNALLMIGTGGLAILLWQ